MGTKGYLEAFTGEDQRHLSEVCRLRRSVWADDKLDPIDRAVLGLTGSVKELDKYHKLANTIGELAGQPIIVIDRVDEKRRVNSAFGGIIADSLLVESSSFSIEDKLGEASGHVMLAVPVTRFVTSNDVVGGVRPPTDPARKTNLTVAHLISHERDNRTSDPERDLHYRGGGDHSLLLGRAAIYQSEHFPQGLYKVLLAVENAAIPVSVS